MDGPKGKALSIFEALVSKALAASMKSGAPVKAEVEMEAPMGEPQAPEGEAGSDFTPEELQKLQELLGQE